MPGAPSKNGGAVNFKSALLLQQGGLAQAKEIFKSLDQLLENTICVDHIVNTQHSTTRLLVASLRNLQVSVQAVASIDGEVNVPLLHWWTSSS